MLYKTSLISRFVTHFLIPYIAVNTVRHSHGTFAEHSSGAMVWRTFSAFLGARVVTVYSAKRMIECEIGARLYSIIIIQSRFLSLTLIEERKKNH
jgi:hypothetical protein